MPATILDYRNPPINEVVIGVQFARLPQLLPPHIGLFWKLLGEEFPTCQHASPLTGLDGQPWVDVETSLLLPRVWLISKDDAEVIQFQNDRLLFNWRRRGRDEKYPRFPYIKQRFLELYGRWSAFAGDALHAPLAVSFAELSYINTFGKIDGWVSWDDLGKVLPDFQWRATENRFLLSPKNGTFQLMLPIANADGVLTVKVNQAKRLTDGENVLRLELHTQKAIPQGDINAASEWFDIAHECIVRGFADLTDEQLQLTSWGREQINV